MTGDLVTGEDDDFKWWRLEIESGKLPKKLLKLRKRDLRSRRPERFGIGWRESFL